MTTVKCRYWLVIHHPSPEMGQDNPYFPIIHQFVREIKWSTGWGGIGKFKNVLQKSGPFPRKTELLNFYYANKQNFPGVHNSKELDMAIDVNCEDQA